ncbi:MAG TPA: glycosyltransferase, partial [Thermoanaerobaculaceae bacterium]|nr:glycosyltransferase [Thermoanaerobaculaceae bacterium]
PRPRAEMEPQPRPISPSRQPPAIGLVSVNPALPSFRLRLAPLVPHLERLGLVAKVHALRGPEWWRVWRLARAWQTSDLLVFSKLKLLRGELGFVARLCPNWVLDVDDAIMFRKPPRHGDPPDQARWRQRRFRRMVRRCELVVAASQSLASAIASEGARVEVLPTPVQLASYPQATLAGAGPLKLAWIGLGANLRYLTDLAPVLRELASSAVVAELRVISDRLPQMPGVPCRLVRWSEHTEGAELAACDVGLAPIPDDAWTRGKGAYRCIQYAAAGLPTVASPVGANREVVVPGETGFWATTPAEWRDALLRLGRDLPLRRRQGAAARERARQYDSAVVVARYAEFLLQFLRERPRVRT